MGEGVYREVLRNPLVSCRVYAPVSAPAKRAKVPQSEKTAQWGDENDVISGDCS
jgi:hypothetical protein